MQCNHPMFCENNQLNYTDLPITGTATVAVTGGGSVTRTADDISALILHYPLKTTSQITTQAVSNTGDNSTITFTTQASNTNNTITGLFWQDINEGTEDNPQSLYLTALREGQDATSAEPLWATFASTGKRESPISFKEMQCRMAKLSLTLNITQTGSTSTSQKVDPTKISAYMNVYAKDAATPITQLAMNPTAEKVQIDLIPVGTSSTPIASFTAKPQLITPQEVNVAKENNTLTVWYNKNTDGVKDADELYHLDLSGLSVTRPHDNANSAFEFNANEHITLAISLSVGNALTLKAVTLSDWTDGDDWDANGSNDNITRSIN